MSKRASIKILTLEECQHLHVQIVKTNLQEKKRRARNQARVQRLMVRGKLTMSQIFAYRAIGYL